MLELLRQRLIMNRITPVSGEPKHLGKGLALIQDVSPLCIRCVSITA
jgi:hypothetical protein